MENNPDIPPDFYGKWWKIVNEKFGEIVPDNSDQLRDQEDHEVANTDNQDATGVHSTSVHRTESNPTPTSDTRHHDQSTREQLSKEESDNLCDYLSIGMSISEARNAF